MPEIMWTIMAIPFLAYAAYCVLMTGLHAGGICLGLWMFVTGQDPAAPAFLPIAFRMLIETVLLGVFNAWLGLWMFGYWAA
jgi:hypothetical protein